MHKPAFELLKVISYVIFHTEERYSA